MTEQLFDGTLVKQFLDIVLIQMLSDMAKGVGYLVVRPAYILDLEIVPYHCRYPPVPNSVQIGCRQDIGQRVIVGSNKEGLVLLVLTS